ncbi:MAG: hypothetical protein PVH88_12100 [Ignavibacteria bacterium]|jgi:hypothetical protein
MDRKIKNTIILIVILVLIIIAGGVYTFVFQRGNIKEKKKQISDLNLNAFNTRDLLEQLDSLKEKAAQLDSILDLRKYNIPVNLHQSDFYDFVNKISYSFNPNSHVNIEYIELIEDVNFKQYSYKLTGRATFNDLYKLIFAIEQSKELKKITSCNLRDFVYVDDDGLAYYLVDFMVDVLVYYSANDNFASSVMKENRIIPNPIYDIYYPLIRNEIPPNINNLLDVQAAELLALIPDGAFIANSSGETFLLIEGDPVYLGYLTEIDFENDEVHFILNKGGIIEKVTLTLESNQEK